MKPSPVVVGGGEEDIGVRECSVRTLVRRAWQFGVREQLVKLLDD